MNALTKFSIALLLITASAMAAYLFLAPSDEGYDAARSQPQDSRSSQPRDGICKQDEERLARLRANPSLDEGLSFVSEIRCLRLWPQLQTIMDGLSSPSRGDATSRPSGAEPVPASDIASARGTTSAALDDACKHDEDRLAELRANPSVQAAVRFDSELKCPRVQPQLPAILSQLSHAAGLVVTANRKAPTADSMSTSPAPPPAASPPALEATSATSGDTCKRDEERLAELQAKPSRDEAVRFEDELKCSRLQLQVLALLDSLSQAPKSVGTPTPDGAPHGATSARETAPPASELASETKSAAGALSPSEAPSIATTAAETSPPASAPTADTRAPAAALNPNGAPPDTATADAAAPRASEPQVSEATSRAGAPSSGEIPLNAGSAGAADTNSTGEATPHPWRPGSQALTGGPANEPPMQTGSVSNDERDARTAVNDTQPPLQEVADAERRIATLESDEEALAAEVSKLQRNQVLPSAEQPAPAASPQPAPPAERSEPQSASQATEDSERRIATLEGEKETLTAEVSKLQHDREAPSAEQAKPIPPRPPALAERSDAELTAAIASLPEGMPARVLIRYLKNNADARAQAEKLASALATQDVEVADVRESRSAIRTELSFCYAPDETIARQVGRVVGLAPVRRLQSKDGLMVRPGTVELNLSGDSHSAAIKTTSTRESNHE
jgi:hypothetical protein